MDSQILLGGGGMSQEMKWLVKSFIRWVILVGITLNIVLWGFILVKCQEHPKHDSQVDVEDTMGFISVQFLSKDDRLVYWKRETKYEVRLSSFGYDKYTKFEGKPEGRICVIYCRTHMFAYLITPCK